MGSLHRIHFPNPEDLLCIARPLHSMLPNTQSAMADLHLFRHCFYTLVVILSIHATLGVSLSLNFDFSTNDYASELNYSNDAYWAKPVIELTNGGINNTSVGRVWLARPVPLWDSATREMASFNTNFSFQIKSSDDNGLALGDGMAFFLCYYPSVTPTESDGGGLGLLSKGSGYDIERASGDEQFVAVEFDTFKNFFDPSGDHVGIDINSMVSNASKDTFEAGKNLSSGLPMTARVSYRNDTMLLSVDLLIDDALFHVSTYVDLRDYLPPAVAVGFSAATGNLVELHQLLSWSFNSSDLEAPKKPATTGNVTTVNPAYAAAAPAVAPQQTHEQARGLRPEILALIVVSGLLGLIMFMVAAFTLKKWCQKRERERECCGPKQYQYGELVKATDGFVKKLGRGGSGEVYYGIDKGRRIAVKKLVAGEEARRRTEFETEVNIISRIRHRNLVHLIGWCDSSNGLLLVYEFISGGSLDKHLYPEGISLLTWNDRFRVIIDLAKALCYLHGEHSDAKYVVHGDIKPSNIMLDETLNAKLGDFGLARLVEHGAEPRTTQSVMGTHGYIEPEFMETRKKCRESDVYSFGIVLLEIVSGLLPTNPQFLAQAWELYAQPPTDRQMERVLTVGLWCTRPARIDRPSIAEALRVLQNSDSQLPVLHRNPPLAALSAVSESPTHRSAASSIPGETVLVPSQVYSNTVRTGGEQAYSSGIPTAAEAWSGTQPSSSNGVDQTATGGICKTIDLSCTTPT